MKRWILGLILLAAAGLAVLLAVLLAAPYWREHALRRAQRPDVLLLTLDTTRADHLGCYGYREASTPNLDGLARAGVLFARAYAHVPLTCPSHASLLTGLLPTRHGVRDNGGFVLGEEPPTMAEQFVEAGYRTGAFVSAFVLDRRFGLARGFATYEDDVLGGADRREASVRGEVTVGRFLQWLDAGDARPVFAWVHLYDPHAPYAPPEPFAGRFAGRPYDGEIAYMDAQIGRLIEAVRGRRRPTLVAVVGDHGEGLGEHGEMTHNYFIYEGTQHVPFLMSWPEALPRGRRIPVVVRGVDVMPTLLDAAGVPAPAGLDGRSLVPLITGRSEREPGAAYLESWEPRFFWGARELRGLRTGRWLFVDSPRPELYDVETDPAASRDLAATRTADLEQLRERLRGITAGDDPGARRAPADPEAAAGLRALGYLGGGAATDAAPQSLPDAKDNMPLLAGFSAAQEAMNAGRREEALAIALRVLPVNPRSTALRELIAEALMDLGRYDEAIEVLATLALEQPRDERPLLSMARARTRQGRTADAAAVLREARQRFPKSAAVGQELADHLSAEGRLPEAEAELRRVVALAPTAVGARLGLGAVLARLGRTRAAANELGAVVERSPRSSESSRAGALLAQLGLELARADDLPGARDAYRSAIRANVVSEDVYSNLGFVFYRMGQRGESLAVLQEGRRVLPRSALLHYRAGRLLQDNGRVAEAAEAYRAALEAEPQRTEARRALDELRGGAAARPAAPPR